MDSSFASKNRSLEGIRVSNLFCKMVMVAVLLISDLFAYIVSFLMAHNIRIHIIPQNFSQVPAYPFPVSHYLPYWWLLAPLVVIFFMEGLYFKRRLFLFELKHLIKALLLFLVFLLAIITLMNLTSQISRTVILMSIIIALFILPLSRFLTKNLMFISGIWKKRILILGAAKTGTHLSRSLKKDRFLGYQVTGFLDDDVEKADKEIEDVKVLGKIDNIQEILQKTTTIDVIIAMPSISRDKLLDIVENCENYVESIKIIPDLFGIATIEAEIESISEFLMINININLKKPWNKLLKRIIDIMLSIIVFVVGMPLYIIIASAIKINSKGPVLFLQKRLGQNERKSRFPCFKFRTMYIDANERLQKYLDENPEAKAEWESFAKLKSFDPRVTGVGKWLRRTSLDELPQVINVILGDMSLVGPRPYLPREIKMMQHMEKTILVAKPGITGLWQVSGRNELSFRQRCNMDIYYVRNWSLWMDLVILTKTAWIVIMRKGAY